MKHLLCAVLWLLSPSVCYSGELYVNLTEPPYLMDPSASETHNTAALQQAFLDAASERSPALFLPAGEYWITTVTVPTDRAIHLRGSSVRWGTTLRQHSSASVGDPLLRVSGSAQEAPFIQSIHLQGYRGHVLEVDNIIGLAVRDVYLSGGAETYALVRATRTGKALFENIRILGDRATHGFWIGDGGTSFPVSTNLRFRNIDAWHASSGQGFPNGHAFFFDNAGGVNLKDIKVDGLECPEASVRVKNGRFYRFEQVGFEYQTKGSTDFLLESTRYVTFSKCALGHTSETPRAIDASDTQSIQLEDCYLNGVSADFADSIHVLLEHCLINQDSTVSGQDVLFEDCAAIDNTGDVIGVYP